MSMIEQMLKQQGKLAARKQLYFSISLLVNISRTYMGMLVKGVEALRDAERDGSLPEGTNVAEMSKVALTEQLMAIRPIYCLCASLKNYKQAFGEYPEFTRFVAKKDTEQCVDEMVEAGMKLVTDAEYLMKKGGVRLDLDGKPLRAVMFGFNDEFQKRCEEIKLKGEK